MTLTPAVDRSRLSRFAGLGAVALLAALPLACGSLEDVSDDPPVIDDPRPRAGSGRSERGGSSEAAPSAAAGRGDGGASADAASSAGDAAPDAQGAGGSPPEAPGCVLDTRTVYVQDGRRIESITAYGTYWSREVKNDGSAVEAVAFPHAVTAEPKFANGPCAGRASCALDSRVVYFDGAAKVESTTAYGTYWVWSFDALGQPVPPPGFPQPLAQTPAFRDGPCAFAGTSACTFDTRTIENTATGRIETITAYGRWFQYVVAPDLSRVTRGVQALKLESIPRYATGACAGQPAGACKLDTRTAYVDLDGARIEEVTARGRLWVYRLSAADAVLATRVDGVRLETIPRLAGPCAH